MDLSIFTENQSNLGKVCGDTEDVEGVHDVFWGYQSIYTGILVSNGCLVTTLNDTYTYASSTFLLPELSVIIAPSTRYIDFLEKAVIFHGRHP